jgi:hypothetical protein
MTTVILFHAHAGVYHQACWAAWRAASATPSALAFRACVPVDAPLAPPFERLRAGALPTQWGAPSIVHAMQLAYDEILAEFGGPDGGGVRLIHLVSSACVPVMHPDALLAMPACRSYLPFADAPPLLRVSDAALAACGLAAHPDSVCTQWLSVTAAHARAIAAAPLAPLMAWLAAVEPLYVAANVASPVADEVGPWAMLRASGVRREDVADDALTNMARARSGDPSPVTWTTLDGARVVDRADAAPEPGAPPRRWRRSLRQELAESAAHEYCFYRKVGAGVDLRGAFPWY